MNRTQRTRSSAPKNLSRRSDLATRSLELIRTVDQNLDSLLNCDTPEDYELMVQRALPNIKYRTSDNPRC